MGTGEPYERHTVGYEQLQWHCLTIIDTLGLKR
jgi:hypothetical protein